MLSRRLLLTGLLALLGTSGGAQIRIGQTAGLTGAVAASVMEITPALPEGFAAAKVLSEGLRRAAAARGLNRSRSRSRSRSGLQRALESLTRYDFGGLELSYSATDHTGLDYADPSIKGTVSLARSCGAPPVPLSV